MKFGISSLIATLMMAGTSFAAKKFWEEIPHQKWNQEQISRILTESPWSQQIHISQAKLQKLYQSTDIESQVRTSRGLSPNPANVSVIQGSKRSFDNTGGDFGSFIPLIVRWETAPPVNWARTRFRELSGLKRTTGVDEWSAGDSKYAVVSISGLPPGIVPLEPEEQTRFLDEIKAQSYLKIRTKARWPPSGGEIRKQQRWAALYLLFPRERIPGIDLRDKSIELVTKISDQKISRKFKLKDMVLDDVLAF